MANLIYNKTTEYFTDYALEIEDGDRIRIEVNGVYITYARCIDGRLAYLPTEDMDEF